MTKAVALAELEGLKRRLSKSQLKSRNEAFDDAATFIERTQATTPPAVRRSFQNRDFKHNRDKYRSSIRVDIEILVGVAFA
jgi:hypothetical protein